MANGLVMLAQETKPKLGCSHVKQLVSCDFRHSSGTMDKKMKSLILCTWWGSKMNHMNSYTKSFGYMGLQIAIAEPFLAFPVEMVFSSNNVGGQSCITWHINLMSSWCEVQIMLLAAKHKFDFFSILAKHEVVFCSAELLWDFTRTMTPSTILQSSMGEYSILKRAPLEMLRPGHLHATV